jgi:hypothetical protein
MVMDCSAARMRHREGNLLLEDVAPGLLGCVRKVEDDAELTEPAEECSASVRQALGRCVDPSGEVVRVVPGQARRTHAAFPPLVKRVGIALERLDPFQREHEPDPRIVEILLRPNLADEVGIAVDEPPELRLLGQRSLTRVALPRAFAVERADLDSNGARRQSR